MFIVIRFATVCIAISLFAAVLFYWNQSFGFQPNQAIWWKWLIKNLLTADEIPSVIWAPAGLLALGLLVLAIFAGRYFGSVSSRTIGSAWSQKELHGSARWARESDIKGAGLLAPEGVIVGGWKDKTLHDNGPAHVLAYAPTRSGKGVSLVIPTLLEWKHSAVVLDIKGENYALTAGYRKSLGQTIIKFDPTTLTGSAKYNPLAEIRLGTLHEIKDTQNIMAMIVTPDGKENQGKDASWNDWAGAFLTGITLYLLHTRKRRNQPLPMLSDVREALSDLETLIEDMQDFETESTATQKLVRSEASFFDEKAPAERSGVLSSSTKGLALYVDPIISQNLSASDFSIADLMNSENPVTLYIIVPPSDLDRLRPLTRLMTNIILDRLTKDKPVENCATAPSYKHRLLLMLDEFTSLGKINKFETSLAYMAGYGLKSYVIIQDLAQLYKAYGKDENITSNCHIQVAFAPNKMETANALSSMAGKTTVQSKKRSRSSGGKGGSSSDSLQETARPLLTPDECRTLPGMKSSWSLSHFWEKRIKPGAMLIFVAGSHPIYGVQKPFFLNKELLARTKMPANHSSKGDK